MRQAEAVTMVPSGPRGYFRHAAMVKPSCVKLALMRAGFDDHPTPDGPSSGRIRRACQGARSAGRVSAGT